MSKPEQTDTIQTIRLKSQLANPNPSYHYRFSLFPNLFLPILSSEVKPNKPLAMQPVPQKPISLRENNKTHPNTAQDTQALS